ncbi:hypothetical protein F4809DRAFT_600955 [Biscogniauxia mediterranea]|nr:hypothetical protein F4809DRAFT_600955 [Biscogniauxia mediterranea]
MTFNLAGAMLQATYAAITQAIESKDYKSARKGLLQRDVGTPVSRHNAFRFEIYAPRDPEVRLVVLYGIQRDPCLDWYCAVVHRF